MSAVPLPPIYTVLYSCDAITVPILLLLLPGWHVSKRSGGCIIVLLLFIFFSRFSFFEMGCPTGPGPCKQEDSLGGERCVYESHV